MDQQSRLHLNELCSNFGVSDLGDGDSIAGINALAVMCCTLAALARQGSGIQGPSGRMFHIGTSVVVSGAASVSLIMDEVLTEVGLRQNHLTQHLERDRKSKEQNRHKHLNCNIFGETLKEKAEVSCSELPNADEGIFGSPVDRWAEVLGRSPAESPSDLFERSRFFTVATSPRDLKCRLAGIHQGRSLVHLGISRSTELRGFGETIEALLDGRLTEPADHETISGQVIATDPSNVLCDATNHTQENMTWSERAVWLSDSSAGPELPEQPSWETIPTGECTRTRFRMALGRGLARRLGGEAMPPQICKAPLTDAQRRWTAFLKEWEKHLPGISGAARNLLATLAFGLLVLSHTKAGQSVKVSVVGIEAFARFLILRMANARAASLHAEVEYKRRSQIVRIFHKLGDVPLDARRIYQHLNLRADDCRECLRWLSDAELAVDTGQGWLRVEGAQLSFDVRRPLTLDV